MRIRIGKIRISLGFPFFAVSAFFLSGSMCENYICAVIFSSLHELGHLIPMKIAGCDIDDIIFGAFGIKIDKKTSALSYKDECIAAICGPLVNAVCAVVCFFRSQTFEMCDLMFKINLGLCIVNLLPVSTLDGGRFLGCFLLMHFNAQTVSVIMSVLGIVCAVLLVFTAVGALLTGNVNTSFVFFVCFTVFLVVKDLVKCRTA